MRTENRLEFDKRILMADDGRRNQKIEMKAGGSDTF
jgi:hypothetical protein